MSELPKISVVIATRNRAHTLRRTIDTLLTDTYPNREIVVWDGNSSDGTQDLLASYGDRIQKWQSGKDLGEYDGYNRAVAMATGEIIKVLTDDDELRPGVLEIGGRWLNEHPDIDILFGQTAVWQDDPDGPKLLRTTDTREPHFGAPDWLRHRTGVYSLSAYIRRSVFDRIGPFSLEYVCGDTEFWVRAAQHGIRFGLMPAVVTDYHLTGDNGITQHAQQIAKDLIQIALKHGTLSDIVFMTTWMGPRALGIEPQVHKVFEFANAYDIHPFRKARAWVAEQKAKRPVVNPRSKGKKKKR